MPEDMAPRPRHIYRINPEAVAMEPLDLDPWDFQSPLPVQHHHLIFQDDDIGLAVGIWDTTTMQEIHGPYPGDEFITVLDGSFAMVDAAGATLAAAGTGDSVVFRNGTPSSWKQEGYLRKIYLTLQAPDTASPVPVRPSDGFLVLPGHPVAADGAERMLFRNHGCTLKVVTRIHAAAALPMAQALTHELCRILSGEMILTESNGKSVRFGPGDHFFVPAGTMVARRIEEGTSAYHVLVAV